MAHSLISRPLTLSTCRRFLNTVGVQSTRFNKQVKLVHGFSIHSSLSSKNFNNSVQKLSKSSALFLNESRKLSLQNRFLSMATPTQTISKDEELNVKEKPTEIFLKDYKPPLYAFDKVDLKFVLEEEYTNVTSIIDITPSPNSDGNSLFLNGEELELLSIQIDAKDLKNEDYILTSKGLTLINPPSKSFQLKIETKIMPQKNTSLEGLYKSRDNFCTQCEAEGFRKITFFQDRPDVMTKFVTRIEAKKSNYPILLSNGNLIEEGNLAEDMHYAVWDDPFPKPSYLFALVAGKLFCNESEFVTKSNRKVKLRIWVNENDLNKTDYAMESLIASMKWDEDVFGLEYDLDLFNIVAVPDFNMGAMENKSLNIFNSRLVLASPETATDGDYSAIEGVIAHEYFHNWTGNRVTCRDWFQLTLKEGLTVYRDQEFSADMNSRGVCRIEDVSRLRNMQFSQDAGPMAHPVRPESYIKMDNFYTVTVYEKGAEIVRMYETLLGKDGFRKGMDLYFERHDGQAVTCDDFLNAMSDANDADLKNFRLWLSQAGTPTLNVKTIYDEKDQTFTINFSQIVPATPSQPIKQPMLIPVKLGLIGQNGKDLKLSKLMDVDDEENVIILNNDENNPVYTTVLRVEKEIQTFRFFNIEEKPVPSLLRNFSAPVRLVIDENDDDLYFRLANDADEFNRWEAGNTIARKMMLQLISKRQMGEELTFDKKYMDALNSIIVNPNLDKAYLAYLLILPTENELGEFLEVSDPDAIFYVRDFCIKQIAKQFKSHFIKLVEENKSDEKFNPNHESKARRSLKHISLSYLASLNEEDCVALAMAEFKNAKNMTEQFSALAAVAKNEGKEREEALNAFYEQWKEDNLVMNKWLSLQASSSIDGNVENVKKLLDHPSFSILEPNKVYALIGGFCSCLKNFHSKDGSGYEFLGDMVLKLDPLNAQVASRMVSAFTRWKKYDAERQALAKIQLERIATAPNLSDNVLEIVTKCLAT